MSTSDPPDFTRYRPIAVVMTYDELHAAVRAHIDGTLRVSRMVLDEATGLAEGLCGRLLSPAMEKKLGPVSLPLVLQAAGLTLVVCEDPATADRARQLPQKSISAARRASSRWRKRRAGA